MAERRIHYIEVHFYKGKPSSVCWSPPRECWPQEVQIAVMTLKRDMAHALHDGEVADGNGAEE